MTVQDAILVGVVTLAALVFAWTVYANRPKRCTGPGHHWHAEGFTDWVCCHCREWTDGLPVDRTDEHNDRWRSDRG